MLGGEGAVGRHPVGGVVRLAERVADAGVAGGKDTAAAGFRVGVVERQIHELVHVAANEHVGVELDDAGKAGEREGHKLGPAVVKARVVGVVAATAGTQVRHRDAGDRARRKGGEPGRRQRRRGQCDKRVGRLHATQGEFERQQGADIVEAGDDDRPDWLQEPTPHPPGAGEASARGM